MHDKNLKWLLFAYKHRIFTWYSVSRYLPSIHFIKIVFSAIGMTVEHINSFPKETVNSNSVQHIQKDLNAIKNVSLSKRLTINSRFFIVLMNFRRCCFEETSYFGRCGSWKFNRWYCTSNDPYYLHQRSFQERYTCT